MKLRIRRTLALFIAVLLALPLSALAEAIEPAIPEMSLSLELPPDEIVMELGDDEPDVSDEGPAGSEIIPETIPETIPEGSSEEITGDVLEAEVAEVLAASIEEVMDPEGATESELAAEDVAAMAAVAVNYIDANGATQTCEDYTLLTGTYTEWTGWVLADGELNIGARVKVNGEAHLILADGAKLTIPNGITVNDGNSLTIYGQSDGDGVGTLTIKIPYSPGTYREYSCIGGEKNQSAGAITINGGDVTATGRLYGAGIGGGAESASGGDITINGGNVTAEGGDNSAGIGGGYKCSSGTIILRGGHITANGGENGAGIGPGYDFTGNDTGALTVSLSNADDYIRASSFKSENSSYISATIDGHTLRDERGNGYFGKLSPEQLNAMAGQKLTKFDMTLYHIAVAETANGTVTVSHEWATEGTRVTLTLTPAESYALWQLLVNGDDVTAAVSGNAYTFNMPVDGATVSASFTREVKYIDANGATQTCKGFTLLTGSETE